MECWLFWSAHWSSKTLLICLFLKIFLNPWILILYPQFLFSQGPPAAPTELPRSHKFRLPLGRVGWGSCSSGLILPFSQLTQHSMRPSPCSPYPSIRTHTYSPTTQSHIPQPMGSSCPLLVFLGNPTLQSPRSGICLAGGHLPWCVQNKIITSWCRGLGEEANPPWQVKKKLQKSNFFGIVKKYVQWSLVTTENWHPSPNILKYTWSRLLLMVRNYIILFLL